MPFKFKSSLLMATSAMLMGVVAAPAHATIIMVPFSSIQGDNVLFNAGTTTGTTVFSNADAGPDMVFNASGATLITSGGQASISGDLNAATPSPGDTINFDTLNFGRTSGGTFNNLEFNLFGGDATTVSFMITDNEGQVFNFANLALGNGSNFFGFQGILGETIRTVAFNTTGGTGIQDIRQIRLDVTPLAAAVPEPTTWAMMLFGFGITGYAMRARRRAGVPVLS